MSRVIRGSGIAVLSVLALALPSAASAAVIAPNTLADEFNTGTACSLREAVQAANLNAAFGGCSAGAGLDRIELAPGIYRLSIPPDGSPDDNADGDLDVQAGTDTSFARAGSGQVVLNGGGVDRVLDMTTGTAVVTINGLVLSGGSLSSGSGGAVLVRGTLTVNDSTFTGNFVGDHGGAVAVRTAGTFTATNTTFSGNTAETDGGAIDSDNATAVTHLINSTVTGNTADAESNASGNGGGINNETGIMRLTNTIVSGNTDRSGEAPDCDEVITSQGGNFLGTETGCSFNEIGTDKIGQLTLGPLAENGGPTPTHALPAGSPALGAAVAPATALDQRGAPRKAPDSGAYERVLCGGVLVNLVGTSGPDRLRGTAAADGILGLAGKDVLNGGKGKDGLCGGVGKDTLRGGPGKDKLRGEGGKDRLIGGGAADRCNGGPGRDTQKSC